MKENKIKEDLYFESIEIFLEKNSDNYHINDKACYYDAKGIVLYNFDDEYVYIIDIINNKYQIVSVGYGSVDCDSFDYYSSININEIIQNDFVIYLYDYTYHEIKINKTSYELLNNLLDEYNKNYFIEL